MASTGFAKLVNAGGHAARSFDTEEFDGGSPGEVDMTGVNGIIGISGSDRNCSGLFVPGETNILVCKTISANPRPLL